MDGVPIHDTRDIDTMSKRTVKDIEKELKRARNEERNSRNIEDNKKFDFIGVDPESKETERPDSSDVPDYIGPPKRKKKKGMDSLPF